MISKGIDIEWIIQNDIDMYRNWLTDLWMIQKCIKIHRLITVCIFSVPAPGQRVAKTNSQRIAANWTWCVSNAPLGFAWISKSPERNLSSSPPHSWRVVRRTLVDLETWIAQHSEGQEEEKLKKEIKTMAEKGQAASVRISVSGIATYRDTESSISLTDFRITSNYALD